jgi:hypothetical protein
MAHAAKAVASHAFHVILSRTRGQTAGDFYSPTMMWAFQHRFLIDLRQGSGSGS